MTENTLTKAERNDRFLTIVYRNDYTDQWHTVLTIDVPSTDRPWPSERRAREHAVLSTEVYNGRGAEPLPARLREWIEGASS